MACRGRCNLLGGGGRILQRLHCSVLPLAPGRCCWLCLCCCCIAARLVPACRGGRQPRLWRRPLLCWLESTSRRGYDSLPSCLTSCHILV